MKKTSIGFTLIIGALILLLTSQQRVFGADVKPDLPDITITSPISSDFVANTSVVVTGKSPVGVLVTVTLKYEGERNLLNLDPQTTYTETITSDQSGDWAYVPSKNLAAGRYSVFASYINPDNNIVTTDTINFNITSTENYLQTLVLFGLPTIVILLFGSIGYRNSQLIKALQRALIITYSVVQLNSKKIALNEAKMNAIPTSPRILPINATDTISNSVTLEKNRTNVTLKADNVPIESTPMIIKQKKSQKD
ncbi:MAG: hypothetical protein ABI721_01005 [Candidatus Dojkabacteria bacterium]